MGYDETNAVAAGIQVVISQPVYAADFATGLICGVIIFGGAFALGFLRNVTSDREDL